MNDDNHKTLQEFAMGEIIKELRAERDALKAELAIANSTGIELLKQKNESAEHISILRKRIDVAEAELEAARKQEPIIIRTMEGFEFLKTYEIGTKLYASPVPAQKECTFHGVDAEACMDYSKEVPCEFTWEQEAKRAFWSGLEIGATFGSCAILPRWNEYIEKRKSELKGVER